MFYDGQNDNERDANPFEALPAGAYKVEIESCADEASKNDFNTRMYVLTFKVRDGSFAGKKIFANFIHSHSNDMAVKIGRAKMKKVVIAATGKPGISRPEELYNRPIWVKLNRKFNDYTGREQNDVVDITGPGGFVDSPNKPTGEMRGPASKEQQNFDETQGSNGIPF